MKKAAVFSVLLIVAAFAAGPVLAAEYDRYEREQPGYTTTAPPQQSLPPPSSPSSPPRSAPVPARTHMNYGPGYVGVQLGAFSPNNTWPDGLDTYDTGLAFNVMLGARMSPFFAFEGSAGYFRSESDFYKGTVSVVPVTIGGRFIFPHPTVEPYLGMGIGVYFADLNEDLGVNDSDVDIGGYMSFGADVWVNPRIALNFEGKYHWVEPQFSGFDVDLSGWNIFFGVRFLF